MKKVKAFQSDRTLRYGLEVSTCNPSTSEVTSVLCLFCHQFGQEDEDVEQTRKRTTNLKYFSYPWRGDNISSHLKKQHPMKWKEYESLSSEDKQIFFVKNESAQVINMRSFIQPEGSMKARIIAKQKFKFIIDADIIETLVFGLLFSNSKEDGEEEYSFE
jgi:hypothetical protein